MFFICLLQLTTGARPNEICQLWTDDIEINQDGIHQIRFVEIEKRQQNLKTKASDRQIYLDKLLIKFGFIEYLGKRKLGMVFDLNKPTQKNWSTFISAHFTKILRQIGIEKKTMYCFRHTATSRFLDHRVDKKIVQDLVGHEGKETLDLF
jgi:integrase